MPPSLLFLSGVTPHTSAPVAAAQASQRFLLRGLAKRGIDPVASADIEAVDLRLTTLCRALSSSLDLEHWKFDAAVKSAIAGTDEAFARLCQAAEPLSSMVRAGAVPHTHRAELQAAPHGVHSAGAHARRGKGCIACDNQVGALAACGRAAVPACMRMLRSDVADTATAACRTTGGPRGRTPSMS